jgi:hypothetical protein
MVKTGPFSFHELLWSGHSSPLAFDVDRGGRDFEFDFLSVAVEGPLAPRSQQWPVRVFSSPLAGF